MKFLTPATFKLVAAAVAAALGFALQNGLVPAEFLGTAVAVSTFLALITKPATPKAPKDV